MEDVLLMDAAEKHGFVDCIAVIALCANRDDVADTVRLCVYHRYALPAPALIVLKIRDATDSGFYYSARYRKSQIEKSYPAGLFGRIVVKSCKT